MLNEAAVLEILSNEVTLRYITRLCFRVFAAQCYASAAYVPSRGVRTSVSFVNFVKTNKHIFNILGSHTILIFPYQMAWQHSDGDSHNGGIECRCDRQKSRFPTSILLHCMFSTL